MLANCKPDLMPTHLREIGSGGSTWNVEHLVDGACEARERGVGLDSHSEAVFVGNAYEVRIRRVSVLIHDAVGERPERLDGLHPLEVGRRQLLEIRLVEATILGVARDVLIHFNPHRHDGIRI